MLTYVDHHPDGGDANDEDDSLSDAPCGVCVQTSHYYSKKYLVVSYFQSSARWACGLVFEDGAYFVENIRNSEVRAICPVDRSWNVSMEAFHLKVSNVTWVERDASKEWKSGRTVNMLSKYRVTSPMRQTSEMVRKDLFYNSMEPWFGHPRPDPHILFAACGMLCFHLSMSVLLFFFESTVVVGSW